MGGPGPPLFLDQAEARRAEKTFFWVRLPPLISGPGWPPPLIWRSGSAVTVIYWCPLMRFTSAHLEAKPCLSVWVFQIEFVLSLFSFSCKGSKGTNYTCRQTGKTAEECRKYNFNCITVGFSLLKEATITSTHFSPYLQVLLFAVWKIKRFYRITGVI